MWDIGTLCIMTSWQVGSYYNYVCFMKKKTSFHHQIERYKCTASIIRDLGIKADCSLYSVKTWPRISKESTPEYS
jgi:hypothetical protein